MKSKSKGTTLVEILVSLAMISIVLIFIFNILSDLKVEDRESTKGSRDSIERASYTRIIQNDFIINKLTNVNSCGTNCYRFTFKTGSSKNLQVNSNEVIYGDEKWTLDSTTFNFGKRKVCNYRNRGNSMFLLIIPTNLNPNTSRKLDLELSYAASYDVVVQSSLLANC